MIRKTRGLIMPKTTMVNTKKIELEKGEKLIITHQGSAWYIVLEADSYDDICVKKMSNYRTPNQQKK